MTLCLPCVSFKCVMCGSLSSCTCIIAYHLGTLDVQRVEPEDDWKLNPQDEVTGRIPKRRPAGAIEELTQSRKDPIPY